MFSRRASAPPLRARLVLVFVLSLSAWQRGLDKFGDDDDAQVFSQTHGVIVASNPHASVVGFGPCFTHAAKPPVLDTHPAFTANGTTKRHAFHENDGPVSLTSPELHAGAGANKGGAPLVLALVRLTNPVDAPLERLDVTNTYRVWLDTHLPIYATAQAHVASERGKVGPGVDVLAVTQTAADPLMWRGRVFCEIDEAAGVLTFSAPLFRGESTLDANDAPSTHALRDALRNVTYVHSGKNPDGAVRGVEFVVVDALGIESAPSAVLIDVFPINDPPTLDLNGVHQPGNDIVVSFGENERNLGVMLTSAAVSIGDPDGDLLARCFVKYDPQGGDTADFPDGDAERILAVVMGTSVTSYWNRDTLTLELTGFDTLDAYMGVLATTRYTHSGLVVDVPNRTRATAFLEFTAGQRNFVITVEDTDGATANASVSVDVQDVIRVGRPSRDENQANPEECSGYGSTKLTIARALSPAQDLNQPTPLYDPEECVCDPGHEGDSCEIHPCGGAHRGLVSFDAANDLATCTCAEYFTGRTCDLECFGNGRFVVTGTAEGGFFGEPGTAGIAIQEGDAGFCVCHKGFAGRLCQVECPGCDGANANCVLATDTDSIGDPVEYVDQPWLCVCSDEFMGPNCDIPCPCAGFEFAEFGNCTIDEVKRAIGSFANVELGKCQCDDSHTADDCSVSCPPCLNGVCVPPFGFEKGVGEVIAAIHADVTSYASPAERRAAIDAVSVDGACLCKEQSNNEGGWGYFGNDCAVVCKPCVHGVCGEGGECLCHAGFSGETCELACLGRGALAFPTFDDDTNGVNKIRDFDRLPGVPGNDTVSNSGLFDAKQLYGMLRDDIVFFNLGRTGIAAGANARAPAGNGTDLFDTTDENYQPTWAYCACGMERVSSEDPFNSELTVAQTNGTNHAGGRGYTGVFCDIPCANCDYNHGSCVWDGASDTAKCVCDETSENAVFSSSDLVPADEPGVGYAGDACDVPCVPCRNGTCGRSAETHGLCVCDPGFSDPACAIECGSPGSATAWSSVVFANYASRLAEIRAGEEAASLAAALLAANGGTDGGAAGPSDIDSSDSSDYEFDTLPTEEDAPVAQHIGTRGRVNATGALPGQGIQGTTSVCVCDVGWTGSLCDHACPFPWDLEHGLCAVKDAADADYAQPWTTEIVCEAGRTGLPIDTKFLLPTTATSKGRDCALPCQTCLFGTCQNDGTCICDYDAIWQGPLGETVAQSFQLETGRVLRHPVFPFPEHQKVFGNTALHETYHGCRALHPCSGNGELFNATCGEKGSGFTDNHTAWVAVDDDIAGGGGWGCAGELVEVVDVEDGQGAVDDYVPVALGGGATTQKTFTCVDPVTKKPAPDLYKFAMAYARFDPLATDFAKSFQREETDLREPGPLGVVQGGYCAVKESDAGGGDSGGNSGNSGNSNSDGTTKYPFPLVGGFCQCDSLRNGRFKHPSSYYRANGAYDYHFQGWAGGKCEIPCAPCSKNGLCDALTGACACHPGWSGYRCLTPCEPCVHGTCQYDGTCLCRGTRRAKENEYALRLTRDPFFLEKGNHAYMVQGHTRQRYVHPSYATTAEVEDYIWELEYECLNRVECVGRASDATHLPTRPNETYFRYTSPDVAQVTAVNQRLAEIKATRDGLVTDVERVPESMAKDPVCDETNDRNEVTKGACLARMRLKTFGRTANGCGSSWDAVRPWLCDDVVKAHFVNERNRKLGVVEVQYLRLQQTTDAENVWFTNNVNERQRLINAVKRGAFNASVSNFVQARNPDYYMVWIVHQLIHGVVSGDDDAYTGWRCDVPCDSCSRDHGTCQYDGSCECADGWYGDRCDRRCDCYRHVTVKNALELRDAAADVTLETVSSFSGYAIRPHGTCKRDGTCACYVDEDGTQWIGVDCFTKCAPCNNGDCSTTDGSCTCHDGWIGTTCSTPTFTECLPCDDTHGTCLSDGSCKCDKGYTGLDCATRCSPCEHGDCRLDGSCHCRPGWTMLDCSKFLDLEKGIVTRSDFSLGDEGWRVHNNSCLGSLDFVDGETKGLFDVLDSLGVGKERATDRGYYDGYFEANGFGSQSSSEPDSVRNQILNAAYQHAAIRGDCHDDGDGGDAGLEWDGSSGYLYLTDKLPNDDSTKGELAFFRAPGKFLGDVFAEAYGGTLSYELYLAGGGDSLRNAGATPSVPHPAGSPEAETPDVYLLGGAPRVGLVIPPWDAWSKTRVVAWSRDRFPELKLDARWAKARVVATVELYLDAPQVVLGVKAKRQRYYPPELCLEEHCALNFAFDLTEHGGWVNYPTIPAGFGWSDVRVGENSPSQNVGGDSSNLKQDPFSYTVETTEYFGETYPGAVPYNPFVGFGGLDDLMASGAYDGNFAAPDPRLSLLKRADGGTANAVGDSSGGKVKKWDDNNKRKWDLYPEVYDAIRANRVTRDGKNASFSEIAWCLSSLTEILIRADYHGGYASVATSKGFIQSLGAQNRATGVGETVRLDHVIVARADNETSPSKWIAKEHEKFLQYAKTYSENYKVMFLADYFRVNAEILRMSICHGNGVFVDGDADNGCVCATGFVGVECQGVCPACSTEGTVGDFNFSDGVTGGCVLDDDPTYASLAFLESIGALEETRGGAPTKCVCKVGFAGLLCDQDCAPCAGGVSECITDPTSGNPACACPTGAGGAYCQHVCPPCDYAQSRCDAGTFSGPHPGTHAVCECNDDDRRTGATCELHCPGDDATNFCGNGECTHDLAGVPYDDTTASTRAADFSFCECDLGFVGNACSLPCPGSATHPTRPGPFPCLGRGACGVGADNGAAVCVCTSGYSGDMCDTPRNMCGDGLVTFNEQCDDGNLVVGDGCDASCVVESWNGWQCVRVPVDGVTQVEGVRISYTSACTLMDA